VVTVVVMATDWATTCCGSAAATALRRPSLTAVATLPAARGALDERRLVRTTASDLNALAGLRGGTVGTTLRTRKRENQTLAPREHGVWGSGCLPQGGEARFLYLGGSTGVVAAAYVATAAPPVTSAARADTSAARAGTSAARAASLTDCLATGAPAPAPGAGSSAAFAALGEGAQAPTSRGELVPHRSSPLPRPTTSTPKSPGKRAPAARAAGTAHSSVPGAPVAGSSSPSCAPPAPVPAAAPRARARARGVGGSDRAAFTITSYRG
jgi:hypothetical protein